MSDETHHERELGGQLLASVSRSFYLTLKALPKELQRSDWTAALTAEQRDYAARDALTTLRLAVAQAGQLVRQ